MINKEEILEKAHLSEVTSLVREYFKECGLSYEDLKESYLYKLREFIQDEIYPLLADKTYHMINELSMDKKIKVYYEKKKKDKITEAYLEVNGSYFNRREAISFNEDGFIGFCGWADGCNRLPFVRGFIKWCDWMKEEKGK